MHCYEYELMCHALFQYVVEADESAEFDRAALADVLETHGIDSYDALRAMTPEALRAAAGVRAAIPRAA